MRSTPSTPLAPSQSPSHGRRAAAFALAAVAVGTAVVSGCSSAAPKHAGAAAGTPPVAAIANDPKARTAVSLTTCKPSTSGWGAAGTVSNPNERATTYTIVVSFTTKQSTVLARGTTKVTVGAGSTKPWTTAASFAKPAGKAKGAVCVLRGVSQAVSS